MLPSPSDLAQGLRFLARRSGSTVPSVATLASLLHEAEQLAAGREADEPAALFFAITHHGRALGKLTEWMFILLPCEQARAVGLELEANEGALAVLRLRVVRNEIDFSELREWFAARLQPLRHP